MEEKKIVECEPQLEVNDVENNTPEETGDFMEMTLREAWPSLCKYIRMGAVCIGKIKIGHLFTGISIVAALLFAYFVIPFIGGIIWALVKHAFDIAIGHGIGYEDRYSFLDKDLLYSVPLCIAISVCIAKLLRLRNSANKWLIGFTYFIISIGTLEYWNYSHIANWYAEYRTELHSDWLGGMTFAIFFVLIPILMWIRPSGKEGEGSNESDTQNTSSEE